MTTIEKIALDEFKIEYSQLGDNEKQWCHDEMINNSKWLDPFWKQEGYECEVDSWDIKISLTDESLILETT